MKLTIEDANRKIPLLLGYSEHEINEGNSIRYSKNGAIRLKHYFDFTNLEDNELILNDIEENNIFYREEYKPSMLYIIILSAQLNDEYIATKHENKLINRMQAYLSWKLGEQVEIEAGK